MTPDQFQRNKEQCHYGILRRTVEKIAESEDYDPYEMVNLATKALKECDGIDQVLDIFKDHPTMFAALFRGYVGRQL